MAESLSVPRLVAKLVSHFDFFATEDEALFDRPDSTTESLGNELMSKTYTE